MSIAFDSQKYVSVETSSARIGVKNGKPFLILVRLKPAHGIHINAVPPISVKSASATTAISVRETHKKGDYLDTSMPIEVDCTVTGFDAGLHGISLVVAYTYCSEDEGWCRMGKDTLTVSVRVTK